MGQNPKGLKDARYGDRHLCKHVAGRGPAHLSSQEPGRALPHHVWGMSHGNTDHSSWLELTRCIQIPPAARTRSHGRAVSQPGLQVMAVLCRSLDVRSWQGCVAAWTPGPQQGCVTAVTLTQSQQVSWGAAYAHGGWGLEHGGRGPSSGPSAAKRDIGTHFSSVSAPVVNSRS